MEDAGTSNKRRRDEAEESPDEAKRLRPDIFHEIFDDDADSGEPEAQDIARFATFMKSFEEEIGLTSPSSVEGPPSDPTLPDLGYLLEASDDELGLPPTTAPSSSEEVVEVVVLDEEPEAVGFEQIWGFDDEISGFNGGGMDFGMPPEDDVAFDGGIFDYPDVFNGTFDFLDNSWRQETQPAI